jgi:hypothetical protein
MDLLLCQKKAKQPVITMHFVSDDPSVADMQAEATRQIEQAMFRGLGMPKGARMRPHLILVQQGPNGEHIELHRSKSARDYGLKDGSVLAPKFYGHTVLVSVSKTKSRK